MNNNYEKTLLDLSSKLDALTDGYGVITKCADAIVSQNDDYSTIALLKKVTSVIESQKYSDEVKCIATALKDSVVRYYGYKEIKEICEKEIAEYDARSLPELLDELNSLIGLDNVKEKVSELIAYQKVQKLRKENGLSVGKNTLHLAFVGNPGTGKTTVARIVGRLYKEIGLLSKGHFVEVSRTDLIAGYQGQTALKVKKVIEKAKGGVLFIDEAYSITENDHTDSYGRECLTELTKALEDYRDDLVVIVAGYTEPMNKFFESNPGLKSRFNTFISFNDYSVDELEKILDSMCEKNDYVLTPEAKKSVRDCLEHFAEEAKDNFANGRLVRNVYEKLVMSHAKRVVELENVDKIILSTLTDEDVGFIQHLLTKNDIVL